MRYLIGLILILHLSSCNEIVKGVTEEISDSMAEKDSLLEVKNDVEDNFTYHLDKDYKILERKRSGEDSLYLVQRYYADGVIYADMWYRNNLRDGISIFYHKDGSLSVKILYKDDKEYTLLQAIDTQGHPLDGGNLKNGTGKLIIYDPLNDAKYQELNYLSGKKNGNFAIYFSNGQVAEKGNYLNNKVQGVYTKYYKDGKVKEKGTFVDGYPENEFTGYFRSGGVHQMEIWKDKRVQYSVEYDVKKFKVKEQKFQLMDSSIIETTYIYGNDGRLTSQGEFKNGLKYGAYMYYHDDGKLKSKEIWKNDTMMSEKTWYESGNIKSQSAFKKGELDSIYTEYYKDGKLRLQQQYKKGKKSGTYFSYYSNGKKYVVGTYANDEPLGKFQYYTKEGVYKGENEFKTPKK
ncbi:MAG: hypothetical protein ABI388_11520 [Bacteroidia bacterium]